MNTFKIVLNVLVLVNTIFLAVQLRAMERDRFGRGQQLSANLGDEDEALQQALLASLSLNNRPNHPLVRTMQEMSRDLEELVGFIDTFSQKMEAKVASLRRQNMQVGEVNRLERKAFDHLGQMQLGIVRFHEAQSRRDEVECRTIYRELLACQRQLEATKQSLLQLGATTTTTTTTTSANPQRHEEARRAPAAVSPWQRTLAASRAARAAHLTAVPAPRQHRASLSFDPHRIPANGLNGLPLSLQGLPGVQILYYPSAALSSRVSGTCGTRAIGNAMAIRNAVLGGSITPVVVFSQAHQYDSFNSHQGTRTDEAVAIASALNLDNFHVLSFLESFDVQIIETRGAYVARRTERMVRENPFTIIESTEYRGREGTHNVNIAGDEEQFQSRIIQSIRNNRNIVAHFMCGINVESVDRPDHAVLVSIVKQEGQLPKIIYMDCNNEPILDQSMSAAFIHYLYLQCIAE